MDLNENWELEIRPQSSLFDLKLSEVWKYRDLMWLFVRRDFVAQYKQTILGPVWHFIQPLITTIMYMIIWGKIANIPTDGIPPILFYLTGISLWTYFSTCLTSTSTTFTSNASIFGKVYFPRLVLPISVVISNIVKFGIQFLLLFIAMVYYHFNGFPITFSLLWLYIPLLLLVMAGISLGLGIIISSITTKYRDFVVLLGFVIQLIMYATPIIYPLSFIKNGKLRSLMLLNPITPIVESFKYVLFDHRGTIQYGSLVYSLVFMGLSLIVGTMMFNKVERSFMDTV